MRARRGWTLPEVLVAGTLALLLFGVVTAIFHFTVGASNQTYVHLDVQLSSQEWLTRVADDLGKGQGRRLFPNRCEIDLFSYSELLRFDPQSAEHVWDPGAKTLKLNLKTPVGSPPAPWNTPLAAYNFDRHEQLSARALDPSALELSFSTVPQTGDRLVVSYPVQNLLTYWLDDQGRLHREERDAQGRTSLQVLNPPGRNPEILCRKLDFAQVNASLLRVTLEATGPRASRWTSSLDVSISEP